MSQNFIEETRKFLNNLPAVESHAARLVNRLFRATHALEKIEESYSKRKSMSRSEFKKLMKEI